MEEYWIIEIVYCLILTGFSCFLGYMVGYRHAVVDCSERYGIVKRLQRESQNVNRR